MVRSEPPFYPDKSKLLVVRDAEGREHPVRTAADWAKRREHILANMQLVMGPLPDDSRKVPLDVKGTETVELLDAKDKLAANYPDCQHDFPPEVRKVAYEWLDRWVKGPISR